MQTQLPINQVVVIRNMDAADERPPLRLGMQGEPLALALAVPEPRPVAPGAATHTIHTEVQMDALVPVIVNRLVEEMRACRQVVAVIVEPGSNPSDLHITIFADSLADETRDAVYSAESKIIDEHPARTFNFHLRQPERVGGQPLIPSAPYATHLWRR